MPSNGDMLEYVIYIHRIRCWRGWVDERTSEGLSWTTDTEAARDAEGCLLI